MALRKGFASVVTVILLSGAALALLAPGVMNPQTPSSTGGPDPRPDDWDTAVGSPLLGPKPLLVILLEFSDLSHNAAVTPSFVQNQIFGPRPSVNDYYKETSYGKYYFSDFGNWAWITAWNDPGTGADESTKAYWNTFMDPCCNGGTYFQWAVKSLDVAGYNFAPLDANGNGAIDFGPEAGLLIVDAQPMNTRGGAMRGMPGGITLDGKTIGGTACAVSSDSPWITLFSHELAHQSSWGGPNFLPDYYGITPVLIGQFSLMGYSAFTNGTGGWNPPIGPPHLDPYSKMKEGWYTATAPGADGFVDVANAEMNPVTYVLFDPAHGKKEYYLVENRWKGTSYDAASTVVPALVAPLPPALAPTDIPDQGLLVWHIDETRSYNGTSTGNKSIVNLVRRGGADASAAWDGAESSYYDWWDGSATTNSKWNDGTNSKVGMWCAGAAGATQRVWLDIPGPGVLICTDPLSASAVPGSAGTISVPLRNTGDATDTFSLTVSAPGDVSVTLPSPVSIPAKGSAIVTVGLTPTRSCTTSPGSRAITIYATGSVFPVNSNTISATLNVLAYGEPLTALAAVDADVYPSETGTYTASVTNNGNAPDTMSLSFTGLDFGATYRAYPTAIPNPWITLSPAAVSASACGLATSTLSIAVPPDWAGMEDATYDFTITATSATTPSATSTSSGQLIVRATPLSMMYYVRFECMNLQTAVGALPPSDVRDGLTDKAVAACAKFDQAMARYVLGEDPPASELFSATQNVLTGFLHLVDAQRGKALTSGQADDLQTRAEQIVLDVDAILAVI